MATSCPKCGFVRQADAEDAAECARCGVILAKARPAPPSGPPPGLGAAGPSTSPLASGVLRYRGPDRRPVNGWLALLVIGGLGAAAAAVLGPPEADADAARAAADAADAPGGEADAGGTVYVLTGKPELAPRRRDGPRDAAVPLRRPGLASARRAEPVVRREADRPPPDPAYADGVRKARRFPKRRWPSRSWFEGPQGYERAWREMQDTRAPLLVYFRTDWCPHCRRADTELIPAAVVRAATEQLVKVRINPDKGPEAKAIAKKFGVTGYPSFFLVPPDGEGPKKASWVGEAEPLALSLTATAQQARWAVYQRGYELQKAKRSAAALAQLTLATEASPDNADAYFWRGLAHKALDHRSEAVADLLRAVKLKPELLYGHAHLATLALEMDRPDDAADHAEQITRRDDRFDRGFGWALRATAEHRRGRADKAVTAARRACRYGDQASCRWLQERGAASP